MESLVLAEEFGATHVVDASKEDPVEAVTRITDGGADYTFVAVGHMPAAEQAWNALAKAGLCVVIGLGPTGGKVAVDNFDLISKERRLAGSFYGTAQPRNDFPRFVNLYKAGKLKLDELVTKRYSIYEANEAFEDLKAGQLARGSDRLLSAVRSWSVCAGITDGLGEGRTRDEDRVRGRFSPSRRLVVLALPAPPGFRPSPE